jgi:hypothetical protein
MKMPFGKYKGKPVNMLPYSYLTWLCSIELKEPLKQNVISVLSKMSPPEVHYEEEIDYTKDIDFWTRVSPLATYDYVKKNNIKVSDDDWKKIYHAAYKAEQG